MAGFDYAAQGFPVRENVVEAHRKVWEAIAGPGSFWTGAQRVGIAEQARAARAQRMQPPWLRELPEAAAGLPPAAVEAARKIAADAPKIERGWVKGISEVLGEAAYVELAAIASSVCAIDTFAEALGIGPEPLLVPREGDPDGARNPSVADAGAHVPLMEPWQGPNVARALSLVPDANSMFMGLVMTMYGGVPGRDFYTLEWAEGSLTRPQVELLAARVSAVNECFY